MMCTMRDIRPFLRLPLLVTLLCLALPMRGQDSITFKTQDPGKGFVEVGGNWRFHTGDDLAWAKPYVDRARAAVARGDVLTLMSIKPATLPALQPSRVDDSGRCRGRCNPMNSAGAVASGIVIARKPIE